MSELSGQAGALTVTYFCPGKSDKCVQRLDKHYDNYCKESFYSMRNNDPLQKQNKTKLKIGFSEIHPVYKPAGNLLTISFFISEARQSRTSGQHKTSTMRGSCVTLRASEAGMPGFKCLALPLASCETLARELSLSFSLLIYKPDAKNSTIRIVFL